ncbi:MAG: 2Fe-2S iron-sulfur cluster binding domain-containing protein [Methylocystaceae bacterium]|nr:2Fe-2S iron-sulfur cluster binding domain-containing protein [Methylocystaceae bacterium]
MAKITFVEADGTENELDVQDGWSLMQAAVSNGIDGIEAECGGSCCCATCHCYVDEAYADKMDAPTDNELGMLEETVAERKETSRLACQIKASAALDGMKVYLPEVQS